MEEIKAKLKSVYLRYGVFGPPLLISIVVLMIYGDVLNAPLRFITVSLSGVLTYVPAALTAGILLVYMVERLIKVKLTARHAFFFGIFVLYCLYTLTLGEYKLRIYAVVYQFIILFATVMIGEEVYEFLEKYSIVILLICVGGVILDSIITLPWKGQILMVGSKAISASREWEAGNNVRRLSGFFLNNFNAGNAILYFFVIASMSKKVNAVSAFVLWVICGYAIYLTTTKVALLGLALMFPLILYAKYGKVRMQAVMQTAAILVASFMISLPFWASSVFLRTNSSSGFLTFDTVATRAIYQWPYAFDQMTQEGNPLVWIFGRGVGGIGYGLNILYNLSTYNFSAENLFVYLYVCYGVFGILALFLMFRGAQLLSDKVLDVTPMLLFISICITGITNTIVDSPICLVLIGVFLSQVVTYGGAKRHRGNKKVLRHGA